MKHVNEIIKKSNNYNIKPEERNNIIKEVKSSAEKNLGYDHKAETQTFCTFYQYRERSTSH